MTPLRAPQVQRLTGATERQLRYWAKTGLARPSIQDTPDPDYPGGRPGVPRLYSPEDVRRIRLIVDARCAGVSVQRQRRILCG